MEQFTSTVELYAAAAQTCMRMLDAIRQEIERNNPGDAASWSHLFDLEDTMRQLERVRVGARSAKLLAAESRGPHNED